MDLHLNLTEKDYRAIAERRANRYYWKSKRGYLLVVGFLGVLIALVPYILTPNNYHYTHGQLAVIAIIPILILSVMFTFWDRVSRIEKAILAKWGIKDKKR